MKKISSSLINKYHQEGWIKLVNFISNKQVNRTKKEIEKFLKKNIVKYG